MAEDVYKRRLVAIFSADAKDYSRLMAEDEAGTLRTVRGCFQAMTELIDRYRGRVVDSAGDNLLAEFPSVVNAVQCAVEVQERIRLRNREVPEDRRMTFRIGINLGDVIEEDGRIYGNGVNIAARIEHLAEGGEVYLSGTAYDQVRNRIALGYEYRGAQAVKNIPGPVRVYKVLADGAESGMRRAWLSGAGRRRGALLVAVPALLAAAAAFLWNTPMKPAPLPVEVVSERPRGLPTVPGEPPGLRPSDQRTKPSTADPGRSTGTPRSRASSHRPPVATRSVESPQPARPAGKTPAETLRGVPLPEQPSIAVLPFENMSGDPDQEHLGDGLADDIITTLSKLPRLFVISRSSTQVYKGKPAKVERISRDLGVRYVLEGSLQKSGNRIRINSQLIDGSTGKHIWAERYDRTIGDLFRTRDQIVLEIAAAMAGKLTDGDVAMLVRRNTNSLEAWEALQRGSKFYERYTVEDNLRGREWFRKAAELDPNYVNAWMNVGWTYYIEGRSFLTGDAREQAFEQAVELAKKVLAMDPSYYGGYMLLSGVHWRRGHHDEAIVYGRRAVEMEPNNTFPVAILGGILEYGGRPEESIGLYQRAMRLSPYYRPWYLDGLALAYHLTGQSDKAIETFKISAKRDPKSLYPHVGLAVIFAEQSRDDEMRAEGAEVMRLNPKFSIDAWAKSHSFKDPAIHENRKALMRKAGLPD